MNPKILRKFLELLVAVRLTTHCDSASLYGLRCGRAFGFVCGLRASGLLTHEERCVLDDLVRSAIDYMGQPFPCKANAGPVMPFLVEFDRKREAPKQPARVPAGEPVTVSAPASRPELRLLCLLVKDRSGETRSLPVHTLRPMPPRVLRPGRWSLAGDPGFTLREAHAVRPSSEVLARYSRQRQSNAVCADSRTVRTGGVSYVR